MEAPSAVANGTAGETLTVYWTGDVTFPVEMIYRPMEYGCPPSTNCTTVIRDFANEMNPLVFPEAMWCSGFTSGTHFGYEVLLRDASGIETVPVEASFDCVL